MGKIKLVLKYEYIILWLEFCVVVLVVELYDFIIREIDIKFDNVFFFY